MTTSKRSKNPSTHKQSAVIARRICLVMIASIVAWLFLASAASAAPNDDAATTFAPIDTTVIGPGDLTIQKAVEAEIDVDCSFEPAIAHVSFTNNTTTLQTFDLAIFGGPGGTVEVFGVTPKTTRVHTVNGVENASLTVRHDGKTLADVEVFCLRPGLLVPVEPVLPTPATPAPGPTVPPLLLPAAGTDAQVIEILCSGTAQPNQIVVQIDNAANGDRTFGMFRSNDGSIEPRSVTLASGKTQAEVFDAVAGDHLMQVYVGGLAILEQDVTVDCTPAPVPTVPVPQVPENVTPTPLLPIPEGHDTPSGTDSPSGDDVSSSNVPGVGEAEADPVKSETATNSALTNDAATNGLDTSSAAELAASAPEAVQAVAMPAPADDTLPAPMLLALFGIGLVVCAGLTGLALGRRT